MWQHDFVPKLQALLANQSARDVCKEIWKFEDILNYCQKFRSYGIESLLHGINSINCPLYLLLIEKRLDTYFKNHRRVISLSDCASMYISIIACLLLYFALAIYSAVKCST